MEKSFSISQYRDMRQFVFRSILSSATGSDNRLMIININYQSNHQSINDDELINIIKHIF